MDGKVVQLVQGREKALEGDAPLAMLEKFAAFPQIQVIDLDAAIGRGSNDELVKLLASRAVCRVGGGLWSSRAHTKSSWGRRPFSLAEPIPRCCRSWRAASDATAC
jgi:phosphoribosylformimino-5-aminoimidazole carboxamide ribonucleotide (ProFAR) isomerase